ncbi:MAG TPA: type II secretion system protein [candidate division WWE3 bacterium]|uniref:Type II secretion system protein n=1 Tax=candidate division WWE3 bacterium TaxID=2053526 RepID=A0A7C1HCM4_UNCKA|nr:type II secretion system protein [candidate division WWE3 bacterium]
MNSKKKEKGQSIIEFIVAVGIMLIVAGSGALSVLGALSANKQAKDHIQASAYAQEGLEAIRAVRNNSWDALENGNHGLTNTQGYWELSGNSDSQGKYTRVITIEDATIEEELQMDTKLITSRVTWNSTPTRQGNVEFTTYLTKWQTVRAFVPGSLTIGTCEDFCQTMDYNSGICRSHPGQCSVNFPYANQFCTQGPSQDTCCCIN